MRFIFQKFPCGPDPIGIKIVAMESMVWLTVQNYKNEWSDTGKVMITKWDQVIKKFPDLLFWGKFDKIDKFKVVLMVSAGRAVDLSLVYMV